MTKSTTSSRKVPILTKASQVEVTWPSTSLVVSSIAMAKRRTANYTIDIFVKVPIIFMGIPGGDIFSDGNEEDHDCTDDIFERGTYIIEGISGGVNHSEDQEWKKKALLH